MTDERRPASGKFSLTIADAGEFATFVGLVRAEAPVAMFPIGTGGFQVTITSIDEFAALVALLRHESFSPSPIPSLIAKLHDGSTDLTDATATA
jgi:hypothetical protein